jgi:hypothetical protein
MPADVENDDSSASHASHLREETSERLTREMVSELHRSDQVETTICERKPK